MTHASPQFAEPSWEGFSGVRPWIGPRYGRSGKLGARVLVLGESMYSYAGTEPLADAVNMDNEKHVMGDERVTRQALISSKDQATPIYRCSIAATKGGLPTGSVAASPAPEPVATKAIAQGAPVSPEQQVLLAQYPTAKLTEPQSDLPNATPVKQTEEIGVFERTLRMLGVLLFGVVAFWVYPRALESQSVKHRHNVVQRLKARASFTVNAPAMGLFLLIPGCMEVFSSAVK
ncbi:MAG: hypothetical protein EON54_13070 [Alcaligenaceae bacterium]|nr:MAG: hypothetical protein EON54_13070 [Alcaligenaceae bacterium]